ncbi:MAG: DUF1566 domain-containing protein, partial [Heliobacteriaceae bacterium]|nr:DUF1566 domain-containing protein [Heliobacteriaceae bacterium]
DGSETVETKNLKNSSDLNEGNWGTKALGIGLINGYTAILSYNPACSIGDITAPGSQTTSCLSLVYDINGKAKPNKMGKDVYTLNANILFNNCIKIGSLCVSESNESYSPIDTCDGTSEYDKNYTTAVSSGCTANRWAGAKKHCDELGMRLPTVDELLSLKDSGISGTFWSSLELYATVARDIVLPEGVSGPSRNGHGKNNGISARCVR